MLQRALAQVLRRPDRAYAERTGLSPQAAVCCSAESAHLQADSVCCIRCSLRGWTSPGGGELRARKRKARRMAGLPWCRSWFSIVSFGGCESPGAFSDLATSNGVRDCPFERGVADLRVGCVAEADQVAADRVGSDLGGVRLADVRSFCADSRADGVGRDHVAADVVAEDAEPGARQAWTVRFPSMTLSLIGRTSPFSWSPVSTMDSVAAADDHAAVDDGGVEVDRQRLLGVDVAVHRHVADPPHGGGGGPGVKPQSL